jgi:hypothetical protein
MSAAAWPRGMCSLALSEEDDQSPEGGVDSQGGQEHGHEVDGVEHHHQHALLGLHAEPAQDVAGVVDSLGEPGEGHLLAVVDVRDAVRAAGLEVAREQLDGGVERGHAARMIVASARRCGARGGVV